MRIFTLVIVLTTTALLAGTSDASLVDRGGGLIYDTVLNVTWLQNVNYAATELSDTRVDQIIAAVGSVAGHTLTRSDFLKVGDSYIGGMSWYGAMAWADQLSYGGYSDWRLPQALPVGFYGPTYYYARFYDGTTDVGWNITSSQSELSHLYYNELKNKGLFDTRGNYQLDWENYNKNFGPFIGDLNSFCFWTQNSFNATLPPLFSDRQAFYFLFNDGFQNHWDTIENGLSSWVVRDGDVATVPIPSGIWLLGSGLVMVWGRIAWDRRGISQILEKRRKLYDKERSKK